MTKDSLQLMIEVFKLQNQVKDLNELLAPSWQKYLMAYTPLIAACIAGGISIYIAHSIFNKSKQQEIQRKIDADLKEKKDLYRKIYSELYGLNSKFITTIIKMNFHRLESDFYLHESIIATNSKIATEQNDLHKNNYASYILENEKISEINSQITMLLAEYFYLNANSKIFEIHKKITNIQYHYIPSKKYAELKKDDVQKYRQYVVDESLLYCRNVIEILTSKLVETLRVETQI
jgi:DNA-directed RNA polymerase beta' subunit